jgi:AraC-like DNA-binding protein
MDTKKPFFDPELSLPALARIAEMPRNSLSQIINDQFGSNFYDFINKYRVEEMKKLLADPQKQARTILSLAFDAGFNSKPAFNTIFKRFTGLTPTQYKKSFS